MNKRMNKKIWKRQKSFLFQLTLVSGLIFATHNYIEHYFFKEVIIFFPLWHIYVFHFVTIAIIYSLINYKNSQGKTVVFNLFMGGTVIKIILAILFLLPLFISDLENKQTDVFNFFIPYFIFLAFEVYSINNFMPERYKK